MDAANDVDKLDEKVINLISTLHHLQTTKSKEWVSCGEVARMQEGSVALAVLIYSIATLPAARPFIRTSGSAGVAKLALTAEGYQLALQLAAQPHEQSQMQEIVTAVKHYASGLPRKSFPIQKIATLAHVDRRFVQAVQIEMDDEVIATSTPVTVQPLNGDSPAYGQVVGQESDENILYIAVNSEIAPYQLPARLSLDPSFLLYQLATALEKLPEFPERAKAILDPRDSRLPISDEDSLKVADMLQFLKAPWTRFLWGPPGAGKTYALGRLMVNLLLRDPECRILLVAPSNLAADVALEQFVAQLETSELQELIQQHRILRYGYPRKAEILARPELLGSLAQREKASQIERLAEAIRNEAQKQGNEAQVAVKRAQLLALQEELKQIVHEHVNHCRVVATTTTLAYLAGSPIPKSQWNTVLIDEVTMVPPATCVYLASLATTRVLFAGDPRQLGPVFQQKSRHATESYDWVGRDIYDASEISKGIGEAREIQIKDTRLTRITRQRRCAPGIWAKVERLYTDVHCRVDERRIKPLANFYPQPEQSFTIVDVSDAETVLCRKAGGSWQNEYTAELAMKFAKQIVAQAQRDGIKVSIAIITPYRAQVKLVRQKIRSYQEQQQTKLSIEAGTIHQFQGSEADIVIFDLVDGPGRTELGKLLQGDTGIRLVNVAITRARGKAIMLAHRKWCKQTMERKDNALLWDIVTQASARERVLSASVSVYPGACGDDALCGIETAPTVV